MTGGTYHDQSAKGSAEALIESAGEGKEKREGVALGNGQAAFFPGISARRSG